MEQNDNNWDDTIAGLLEILCAVAIFIALIIIH